MKDIGFEARSAVIAWMKKFSAMVRENNFMNAELMFEPESFGFGTIAESYSSLKEYRSLQWNVCWIGTKDFEFDYSTLQGKMDGNLILVGTMWSGIGIRPGGEEYHRDGRVTIVFMRKENGALMSIHNHYSRIPRNYPQDF